MTAMIILLYRLRLKQEMRSRAKCARESLGNGSVRFDGALRISLPLLFIIVHLCFKEEVLKHTEMNVFRRLPIVI